MCFNSTCLPPDAVKCSDASAVPEKCVDAVHSLNVLGRMQSATAKARRNELVGITIRYGAPARPRTYATSDSRLMLQLPAQRRRRPHKHLESAGRQSTHRPQCHTRSLRHGKHSPPPRRQHGHRAAHSPSDLQLSHHCADRRPCPANLSRVASVS
jgi:hypothetical protein